MWTVNYIWALQILHPHEIYGLNKENFYEQFINDKYGKVSKTGHYDIFDYENNEILIEIKNRNNTYDAYSTTMVGINKIEKGLLDTRNVYFLFGFNDGSLFEWKLDKTKTYDGKTYTEFSSSNYTTFNKHKLNYYIPIKELTCLISPPKPVCLIRRNC